MFPFLSTLTIQSIPSLFKYSLLITYCATSGLTPISCGFPLFFSWSSVPSPTFTGSPTSTDVLLTFSGSSYGTVPTGTFPSDSTSISSCSLLSGTSAEVASTPAVNVSWYPPNKPTIASLAALYASSFSFNFG